MNGLAREAVLLLTDWAHEKVNMVLVNTPAYTVCRLTVKTIGCLTLSRSQTANKILIIHVFWHQL